MIAMNKAILTSSGVSTRATPSGLSSSWRRRGAAWTNNDGKPRSKAAGTAGEERGEEKVSKRRTLIDIADDLVAKEQTNGYMERTPCVRILMRQDK